jgi:uncharacterized repeat protein (TIGR04076 family)
MTEWYQVKAEIISQKGHCHAGHKIGDQFIIGDVAPTGLCAWAFYTLSPLFPDYNLEALSPGRKTPTKLLSLAQMGRTRLSSN